MNGSGLSNLPTDVETLPSLDSYLEQPGPVSSHRSASSGSLDLSRLEELINIEAAASNGPPVGHNPERIMQVDGAHDDLEGSVNDPGEATTLQGHEDLTGRTGVANLIETRHSDPAYELIAWIE